MGLVYSSGDSSKLMSAMSSNLSTAKSTVSDLRSGSQRLTAAVDGRTLSGAAYNAGKGLFSELILPTISRVTTSMDGIQNDLVKYTGANAAISSEGFLDEDKLNMQMQLLKASKAALSASANAAGNLAAGNPVPGLKDMLKHAQNRLNRMANSMQDDIDKVQKKIKKLHDFSSQTNGLFSSSLNELSIAMQGVLVLSGTVVNSDGSYSLPKGTDKSWFKSLKSTSKNSSNYDAKKALKDFLDGLTPSEFSTESLSDFLDKTRDKVIKEGKNIGRSWAGKLQPKSTLGTFVSDTFKPRKWLTSKLRKVPNSTSKAIGNVAKWGGKGLFVLGAYSEFKDFYGENHNVGRALTYSMIATTAGYVAGTVGSAVAGSLAVTAGAAATGFIATVAAPVAGAVVVGAAVAVGVKAVYNNWKPFKDTVDGIGDSLNNVGSKVKDGLNNVGKALTNPLKSLKGAFG
ncbi:hypothetical protein JZO73_12560 [Enterococcus plantarum]|uniref:T7SS effector LXG polymorphic toxin n=1 Tax=Enterococcus plantarum TaxID=1077675 RepID=UPI001A8E0C73|nr:T7SS effector LXG polymorphic toxin [Enterococcus plantarum]MBO0468359.1 hypothetical protein [Enterococcus plantarum]